MLRLFIIAMLTLLPCMSFGQNTLMLDDSQASSPTYPDVIFYWSCDSTTAEKSSGDTTATSEVSAAIDTSTYQVGTGSCSFGGSYSRFDFTLNNDDLADMETGRVGMWVRVTTNGSNSSIFRASYDANNYIKLAFFNTDYRVMMDYYAGGSGMQYEDTAAGAFALNTWFFLEYSWNKGAAGNDFYMYINGTQVATLDASSGTWAKSAAGTLTFGDIEGNGAVFRVDNIIISNDPTRDLYALRNNTSF